MGYGSTGDVFSFVSRRPLNERTSRKYHNNRLRKIIYIGSNLLHEINKNIEYLIRLFI